MVALLQTKFQITNKMTTKNKFSENDLNATIGNTVLGEEVDAQSLIGIQMFKISTNVK